MRRNAAKAFISVIFFVAFIYILYSCTTTSNEIKVRDDSYFNASEKEKEKREKKFRFSFGYAKGLNFVNVHQRMTLPGFTGDAFMLGFAKVPMAGKGAFSFRWLFWDMGNYYVTGGSGRKETTVSTTPLILKMLPFVSLTPLSSTMLSLLSVQLRYTHNLGYIKNAGPFMFFIGTHSAPITVINGVTSESGGASSNSAYTALGGGMTVGLEFFIRYPLLSVTLEPMITLAQATSIPLITTDGELPSINEQLQFYLSIRAGVMIYAW